MFGTAVYATLALAQALFTEETSYPLLMGLETARLIVPYNATNGTTIEKHYTNQHILGDITLNTLSAQDVPMKNAYTDSEFNIYDESNTNSKLVFDVQFTNAASATVGIKRSGTYVLGGIADKDAILTTPANNHFLKYDGTKFVNSTIASTQTDFLTAVGNYSYGGPRC